MKSTSTEEKVISFVSATILSALTVSPFLFIVSDTHHYIALFLGFCYGIFKIYNLYEDDNS